MFTPAISAMLPLSLLATPAVPIVLEKSELGRIVNLFSLHHQQQQAGASDQVDLGETFRSISVSHDPMHAVAPVHGRPRRNSLPGSVGNSRPVRGKEERKFVVQF